MLCCAWVFQGGKSEESSGTPSSLRNSHKLLPRGEKSAGLVHTFTIDIFKRTTMSNKIQTPGPQELHCVIVGSRAFDVLRYLHIADGRRAVLISSIIIFSGNSWASNNDQNCIRISNEERIILKIERLTSYLVFFLWKFCHLKFFIHKRSISNVIFQIVNEKHRISYFSWKICYLRLLSEKVASSTLNE